MMRSLAICYSDAAPGELVILAEMDCPKTVGGVFVAHVATVVDIDSPNPGLRLVVPTFGLDGTQRILDALDASDKLAWRKPNASS